MRMSLFSRSIHLIFGRPLGFVPVTFTLNVLLVVCVSSLRITCPYHDSRFCVRTDLIGITFAFRYISVLKWDPTKCTLLYTEVSTQKVHQAFHIHASSSDCIHISNRNTKLTSHIFTVISFDFPQQIKGFSFWINIY